MPEAQVLRTFDLVRKDGTEQRFEPGMVDFTDDDFDHWQVQGNIAGGGTMPPKPGSYEYHQVPAQVHHLNGELSKVEAEEALEVAKEQAQFQEQASKSAAERREKYQERITAAASADVGQIKKDQQKFQQKFSKDAVQGYRSQPVEDNSSSGESEQQSTAESTEGEGGGETGRAPAAARPARVRPTQQ